MYRRHKLAANVVVEKHSYELFVAELAKASYTQAVLEKRKTIQTKDIDRAISSKAVFEFLEGTLSDWPETESSKGISQTQVSTERNLADTSQR
ncbi:hypothetical protein COOONC_09560 [Cooperia oncophora]